MGTSLAMPITDGGDVGSYARHIPAIRKLLSTLPEVHSYTTFRGGTVLKLNPSHYVAVLLPPTDEAEANLLTYLAETFDGTWQVPSMECLEQIEAWHLTPPWST